MPPTKAEINEEPEFRWGRKRGIGGKKKDVQFYESFTYDGIEYALYDCVYLSTNESVPYVAKIIKIWENGDKSKKIKVQWFFYPFEISYYLDDEEFLENELLLASGAGSGLTNLNTLEVIGGKCNVVCISKDSRNPQPSAEELQLADFVFYRTFDVERCTISDQLGDSVGGLEVKFVFNRKEDFDRLDSNGKDDEINAMSFRETPNVQELENVKLDHGCHNVLEKESLVVKHVQAKLENSIGETEKKSMDKESALLSIYSGVDVNSDKCKEVIDSIEKTSSLSAKNVECKVSAEKDKFQDIRLLVNQVQVEDQVKHMNNSCILDAAPQKRAHIDGKVPSSKVKATNGMTIPDKEAAQLDAAAILSNAKPIAEVESSCVSEKDVKPTEKSSTLDKKSSKASLALIKGTPNEMARSSTTNVMRNEKRKSECTSDFRGPEQAAKFNKTSSGIIKGQLKKSADLSKAKPKCGDDANHEIKDTKLAKVPCNVEEGPTKKAKFDDSMRKSNVDVNDDNNMVKKLKEKLGTSDVDHEIKDTTLAKVSCHNEDGPTEKERLVDSMSRSKVDVIDDNSTVKMLRKKFCGSETKSSPTLRTSNLDKGKSKVDNGPSTENHNEKGKISNDDSKVSITTSKGNDKKVEGQKFEVFPRPLSEKSNWIKLPWEERMKTAHDQGKLLLLLNLAPYYTSGEVEDIIWHAFNENCTAKVLPRTATSNPNSGQAFVIFKTRVVAERVAKRLEDGCLMLPNRRPLVACTGVLPKSDKQTTFFGHLGIDKARMQILRESKEAVSTSHYSQNNTIEYEMAMSWCLQQSKSDMCWKQLYEQQVKDVKKFIAGFKSK